VGVAAAGVEPLRGGAEPLACPCAVRPRRAPRQVTHRDPWTHVSAPIHGRGHRRVRRASGRQSRGSADGHRSKKRRLGFTRDFGGVDAERRRSPPDPDRSARGPWTSAFHGVGLIPDGPVGTAVRGGRSFAVGGRRTFTERDARYDRCRPAEQRSSSRHDESHTRSATCVKAHLPKLYQCSAGLLTDCVSRGARPARPARLPTRRRRSRRRSRSCGPLRRRRAAPCIRASRKAAHVTTPPGGGEARS